MVDPNTVRRIAALAEVGPGDHVLEVGAGLGALTLALDATGAAVTSVEADRRLLPALAEVLGDRPVDVVHADIRRVDWDDLLAAAGRWTLVANLPYNVATPIVLQVLEEAPAVERALVMVQREVGERLAAGPGSGAYGIPSVLVALRARAEVVGRVSPEVFLPRPNVDSALVRLTRREPPETTATREEVFAVVDNAFAQRRKTLRAALAGWAGSPAAAEEALRAAGIDPSLRGERLGIAEFARIAQQTRSAGAPGARSGTLGA